MSEFTEDELVETIRRLLAGDDPRVRVGIGDDAAIVEVGPHAGVLTSDVMIEGVHFDLALTQPRDLGHKALSVNVSDVAAMGGSPRYALVTLAIPPDTATRWVVELYGGLRDAAAEYAMSVVGGDTSRSERVVVSVAVVGEVAEGHAVTRSGARPGDAVAVTGTLGAAAGGLELSRASGHDALAAAGSEWGRDLVAAFVRPVARVGEGQTLAQSGATAMIDVSDGLAKDLGRLCAASGVGAVVSLADVPVASSLKKLADLLPGIDPLDLALSGGEDYELLVTIPPYATADVVAKLPERFGTPLTVIGEIREGHGMVSVDADGAERALEPKGWDHFAK